MEPVRKPSPSGDLASWLRSIAETHPPPSRPTIVSGLRQRLRRHVQANPDPQARKQQVLALARQLSKTELVLSDIATDLARDELLGLGLWQTVGSSEISVASWKAANHGPRQMLEERTKRDLVRAFPKLESRVAGILEEFNEVIKHVEDLGLHERQLLMFRMRVACLCGAVQAIADATFALTERETFSILHRLIPRIRALEDAFVWSDEANHAQREMQKACFEQEVAACANALVAPRAQVALAKGMLEALLQQVELGLNQTPPSLLDVFCDLDVDARRRFEALFIERMRPAAEELIQRIDELNARQIRIGLTGEASTPALNSPSKLTATDDLLQRQARDAFREGALAIALAPMLAELPEEAELWLCALFAGMPTHGEKDAKLHGVQLVRSFCLYVMLPAWQHCVLEAAVSDNARLPMIRDAEVALEALLRNSALPDCTGALKLAIDQRRERLLEHWNSQQGRFRKRAAELQAPPTYPPQPASEWSPARRPPPKKPKLKLRALAQRLSLKPKSPSGTHELPPSDERSASVQRAPKREVNLEVVRQGLVSSGNVRSLKELHAHYESLMFTKPKEDLGVDDQLLLNSWLAKVRFAVPGEGGRLVEQLLTEAQVAEVYLQFFVFIQLRDRWKHTADTEQCMAIASAVRPAFERLRTTFLHWTLLESSGMSADEKQLAPEDWKQVKSLLEMELKRDREHLAAEIDHRWVQGLDADAFEARSILEEATLNGQLAAELNFQIDSLQSGLLRRGNDLKGYTALHKAVILPTLLPYMNQALARMSEQDLLTMRGRWVDHKGMLVRDANKVTAWEEAQAWVAFMQLELQELTTALQDTPLPVFTRRSIRRLFHTIDTACDAKLKEPGTSADAVHEYRQAAKRSVVQVIYLRIVFPMITEAVQHFKLSPGDVRGSSFTLLAGWALAVFNAASLSAIEHQTTLPTTGKKLPVKLEKQHAQAEPIQALIVGLASGVGATLLKIVSDIEQMPLPQRADAGSPNTLSNAQLNTNV